jgi:hypothetical protein
MRPAAPDTAASRIDRGADAARSRRRHNSRAKKTLAPCRESAFVILGGNLATQQRVFLMKVFGVIALAGVAVVGGSVAFAQRGITPFDDPALAQKMVVTLKSAEAQCEAHYPSGDGVRVCGCISAVTMMASITSTPDTFSRNSGIVQNLCNKAFRPDLQ